METVDKSRPAEIFSEREGEIKRVLGVFAKQPRPGRAKTRLSPPFSAAEAAELYGVFLRETVTAMGRAGIELVLCYAGDEAYFRCAFPGLPLLPQGEGDLGARMDRALCKLLASGYGAAALIGSDTPDLPVTLIDEAFGALLQAEVVVAPAPDGGYVLVGGRRPVPELFRDIPWSTAEVLAATRRRAAEAGTAYREIGGWEDVDDLASLRRLLKRSPASSSARQAEVYLARHGL